MTPAETLRELEELEIRLERLRIKYDQYFTGTEKMLPWVQRKDVDRRFQTLHREQMRNTGTRFRFQTLVQRFTMYQTYWGRIIRQIEEGTFRRDVIRAQRMGLPNPDRAAKKKKAEEDEIETLDDIEPMEPDPVDEEPARTTHSSTGGTEEMPGDLFAPKAPRPAAPPLENTHEPEVTTPLPTADDFEYIAPPRAITPPPRAPAGRPAPPAPVAAAPTPTPSAGMRAAPPPVPVLSQRPPALGGSSVRGVASVRPGASAPPTVPAPPSMSSMPPADTTPPPPPPTRVPPPGASGGKPFARIVPVQRATVVPVSVPSSAPPPRQPSAAPPATTQRPATSEDPSMRQLFDRYVAARKQTGESTDVRYETVAKQVRDTLPRLSEKYVGADVRLDVTIKDGKAILRPVVTMKKKPGEGG